MKHAYYSNQQIEHFLIIIMVNERFLLSFYLTFLFIFFLLILGINAHHSKDGMVHKNRPCRRMVVYFHDILYNGKNKANATSVLVGAPAWGSLVAFAGQSRFGDVVVFDNPITLGKKLDSPMVGRAQGMYSYDGRSVLHAWMSFSFTFNSDKYNRYNGSINFAGGNQMMSDTRDISVVGGTGDFFMTRGIATISTDAYEDHVYFRLRFDVKLYECY